MIEQEPVPQLITVLISIHTPARGTAYAKSLFISCQPYWGPI